MANGQPIPLVGKCFDDADDLEQYLNGLTFGAWRPRFVTLHHTGAPNRAQWDKYQTRKPPITDAQWMKNLARYYGVDMGWSAGPHFFVTPAHFCVLSPPNARGVHAVSFNANSWGVEVVGDFDTEQFTGEIRKRTVECLAVLHLAAGLQPGVYVRGVSGLHFHRDDPKTAKTCPGKNVDKAPLIWEVHEEMEDRAGGSHVDGSVEIAPPVPTRTGTITAKDFLNVRADPSAKSPIVRTLQPGNRVIVYGEAMNLGTKWLRIAEDDWVAAGFVAIDGGA
jgi:hypothetical protein